MKRYKAAEPKIISSAEYLALAELRYQIRRFLHFSEEASRAAGVEPQQHQLLLVLKRLAILHIQPTVGVLAERLQVQHHSAVELVDRSVERGLARRTRDQQDRRQVLVELTQKGERLLRDLTLHHRDALSIAAPALRESLNTLMQGLGGWPDIKPGMSTVSELPRRRSTAPPASKGKETTE